MKLDAGASRRKIGTTITQAKKNFHFVKPRSHIDVQTVQVKGAHQRLKLL